MKRQAQMTTMQMSKPDGATQMSKIEIRGTLQAMEVTSEVNIRGGRTQLTMQPTGGRWLRKIGDCGNLRKR